nr:hypothetical protein [Tanacetum cinerariifolium]
MKDVFEELEAETTDSQITKLTNQVTHLQAQNDLFRAENDKIKQHYKELYDSIKITRAKHIKQVTNLINENVNLKTCVSKATVNPQVSARDTHAIDVEPVVPRLRNNRNAHLDYLSHLKESVETIRNIIEEAKVVRPLDRSIVSACRCTKHPQELLEYAIGTCPQGSQPRAKQLAHTPFIRKKQVSVAQPFNKLDSTTHRHVVTVKPKKTNVPVPPSTGVNSRPNASGSQHKSHVMPNRILPAKGDYKLPVDDQPRKISLTLEHRIVLILVVALSALLQPGFHSEESSSPKRRLFLSTGNEVNPGMDYFISVLPRSNKIMWNSRIRYREVAHQSGLMSHKFVTQSMTTALSIENGSLVEGESNFEIYDTNQASQNREQSSEKILISKGVMI